jgi:hypothetical protein
MFKFTSAYFCWKLSVLWYSIKDPLTWYTLVMSFNNQDNLTIKLKVCFLIFPCCSC